MMNNKKSTKSALFILIKIYFFIKGIVSSYLVIVSFILKRYTPEDRELMSIDSFIAGCKERIFCPNPLKTVTIGVLIFL